MTDVARVPMVSYWRGQLLTELTHTELIAVVKELARDNEDLRDRWTRESIENVQLCAEIGRMRLRGAKIVDESHIIKKAPRKPLFKPGGFWAGVFSLGFNDANGD